MATINAINNISPQAFTVSSGDLTITTGDAVVTAGVVSLPTTSSTGGQILLGASVWAHSYGTNNVFYGQDAGNFTFDTGNAVDNTVFGAGAFSAIAGADSLNDARNVVIGYNALAGSFGSGSFGSCASNVIIGTEAVAGTAGANDIFASVVIGDKAGYYLKGSNNVVIGYRAFQSATNYISSQNVIIGYSAGNLAAGGSNNNVVIGYQAYSTINGYTLNYTTAIGTQAGGQLNSNNSYNTFFGYRAGYNYTNSGESSNICIGYNCTGTAGESNVLRIGIGTGTGNGQLNKAYISGIYNIAVGATAGAVIVDSTNQVGTISGAAGTIMAGGTKPAFTATPSGLTSLTATTLYATTFDTNVAAAALQASGTTIAAAGSNTDISITISPKGTGTIVSLPVYSYAVGATNRAMLVDDSGNIGNATSSRRFKENIQDMGDASSAIMNLRPVTFNYRSDKTKTLKTGLIAEEVALVMPELVSFDETGMPYTVSYHELPALLLNELQKLSKRVDALAQKISAGKDE